MKPVIKQKRRDPRYFLHESVEEKLSQAQQGAMDTDDDGDIDEKDLAVLRKGKKKGKQEHEKSAKGQDQDPQTPGDQQLLLGDKSLYEKIRSAIEEVFNEYLEEDK